MMTNLSLTREVQVQVEVVEEEEEEAKKQQQQPIEETRREHMFDKVVTPSDVGKLNRLVIPKQHAERYFPLDTTSNEKGLLLNFEDLSGKSWRFRYSYWNSSQSYVMTKGWSRFVKDKKLDAGDIVSFQRCVGDSSEGTRLFIDWRRRPKVPEYPIGHFPGGTMFPRFYNFPTRSTTSTGYGIYNPYLHQTPREFGYGYFVRSVDQRNSNPTAVIDSVPVMMSREGEGGGGGVPAHQAGKRLRLFGVDMECSEIRITTTSTEEEESSSSNGSLPRAGYDGGASLVQLRLGGSGSEDDHFSKKGKSSLSFDLDQS